MYFLELEFVSSLGCFIVEHKVIKWNRIIVLIGKALKTSKVMSLCKGS